MIGWQWKKKEALAEQLKFFGAKKQRFISVYASKPRILVKVKVKTEKLRGNNKYPDALDALLMDGIRRNGLEHIRSSQFQAQQARQFDYCNNPLIGGLSAMGAINNTATSLMSGMAASNAALQAQQCAAGITIRQQNALYGALYR
jgi:hypothetical protein